MRPKIIDVDIEPRTWDLSRLGVSESEFVAELDAALERLADCPRQELPRAADIALWIQGKQRRLGDMAAIRATLG
jgi:hypothetical protein